MIVSIVWKYLIFEVVRELCDVVWDVLFIYSYLNIMLINVMVEDLYGYNIVEEML